MEFYEILCTGKEIHDFLVYLNLILLLNTLFAIIAFTSEIDYYELDFA